jgi:lycopene beta-cyclase
MKQKFDIGIIGAGLSGLTLGNSLLSKKIKNFILIEKNTHLKNDKTYSFWSGPGLFDIKKSFSVKPKKEWSQIEIKVKINLTRLILVVTDMHVIAQNPF